jgi:hypothetical protein
MQAQSLSELLNALTPEQQAAVREFVEFLTRKSRPRPDSPFLAAIDEFMDEHPELLRRLAQ